MKRWGALIVLSAAQFLMVLDQAVMNVSISQLVEDFETTVTAIQGVITFYSLVMAALMITGGKIGDLIGRRRAFSVGLVIYGIGSALTAVSWSVPTLLLGWSVLEGIGAALVLPALAALIAGNYEGQQRVVAYAVIGGVAGAGIAVGPILGGWMTTELSWRYVFVGEVIVAVLILLFVRLMRDVPNEGPAPKLDVVGAVLSALGVGLIVYGVLQASTWGWISPVNSPVEPLGFALTPFVVGAGVLVTAGLFRWLDYREAQGQDPLFKARLLDVPPLRAGLETFLAQNVILMGVFFTIPLYLQLVVGLDALDTGIRMLPVSVAMFVTSMAGSRLATRYSARSIIRTGLGILLVAVFALMGTVEPELVGAGFGISMALLGLGMGLLASQLGNVVQSAVGHADRSEAGGLQYTAQQLGSSLGVALIGAIVLTGLSQNFIAQISADPRIEAEVTQAITISVSEGVDFVAASDVEAGAAAAGLADDEVAALVESYSDAQIFALKGGLLAVTGIVALSFLATGRLPAEVPTGREGDPEPETAAA